MHLQNNLLLDGVEADDGNSINAVNTKHRINAGLMNRSADVKKAREIADFVSKAKVVLICLGNYNVSTISEFIRSKFIKRLTDQVKVA